MSVAFLLLSSCKGHFQPGPHGTPWTWGTRTSRVFIREHSNSREEGTGWPGALEEHWCGQNLGVGRWEVSIFSPTPLTDRPGKAAKLQDLGAQSLRGAVSSGTFPHTQLLAPRVR